MDSINVLETREQVCLAPFSWSLVGSSVHCQRPHGLALFAPPPPSILYLLPSSIFPWAWLWKTQALRFHFPQAGISPLPLHRRQDINHAQPADVFAGEELGWGKHWEAGRICPSILHREYSVQS